MKKIQIVSLLFTLCICLTACDPGNYSFDYEELLNNVAKIELINYDNPDQKRFISWVPDHSSRLVAFIISNMTILEISTFLNQLSDISFLYKYYCFNSPKGISIRITYENGDFEIFSCDYESQSYASYVGKYTNNGDVVSFVGSFESYYDFENLLNNFLETNWLIHNVFM